MTTLASLGLMGRVEFVKLTPRPWPGAVLKIPYGRLYGPKGQPAGITSGIGIATIVRRRICVLLENLDLKLFLTNSPQLRFV